MSIREEIEKDEKVYFKPDRIAEAHEELKRLDMTIRQAREYGASVDSQGIVRRKRQIEGELEAFTPKPIPKNQVDAAIKLEEEYREKILEGMPTQVEMRTAAPGVVSKHQQWEKRVKPLFNFWRRTRARLGENGVEFSSPIGGTIGRDSPEYYSAEVYRPRTSLTEGNTTGGVIESKKFHNAERADGSGVVLSSEELAFLHENYPSYASQIATMDNEQRAEVKSLVTKAMRPRKKKG